jgi:lysophospholipase L1-like esterase
MFFHWIPLVCGLPQVILMGDSITEMAFKPDLYGYASLLQDRYMRQLDIVNRGYGGYNTEWYKYLVSVPKETAAVVLFLGANDAVIQGKTSVPVHQYKQNLVQMGTQILNSTRLVLVTPPPVDGSKWNDRTLEHTLEYRYATLSVATQLNVPCVDLWPVFLGI